MMYEPKYVKNPPMETEIIGLDLRSGEPKKIPRDCPLVKIELDEYAACVEHAKNRWSNKKKGQWGSGMINTAEDPYRVERLGLIGEFAVAKIKGWSVDLAYRKEGDKQDFLVNNIRINAKNSSPESYSHEGKHVGLIKTNQLVQDVFVFTHTYFDDREDNIAGVVVLGWIYRDKVLELDARPGMSIRRKSPLYDATHYNYEVPYVHTYPIWDL